MTRSIKLYALIALFEGGSVKCKFRKVDNRYIGSSDDRSIGISTFLVCGLGESSSLDSGESKSAREPIFNPYAYSGSPCKELA